MDSTALLVNSAQIALPYWAYGFKQINLPLGEGVDKKCKNDQVVH
jgi:hypothetical protein